MGRVAVEERVLLWAVQRSGMEVSDLEPRFPRIREWIDGKRLPTLRQLESLAKATLTPLGFFFLKSPLKEVLPVPHYRTLGDETVENPSIDLLDTVQCMQQRQAWMREFLIDQGHQTLSFVGDAQASGDPQSVAKHIRIALGLNEDWAAAERTWTEALSTLREAAEAAGILVVVNGIVGNNTRRKLDPEQFRGFVLVDDYAPLVFLNGADGKAAQMFTLAHELAHVLIGSSAAFDLRQMMPAKDPTEQRCNRIAAEFLVPEEHLRGAWPLAREGVEPFQNLARQFKVSSLVAARRALDVGLINRQTFLAFFGDYQRDERRKARQASSGGDFYLNQNLRLGQRFAAAVVAATRQGKLLYSEAYQLTGLHGRTFDRYAASLGFGETR